MQGLVRLKGGTGARAFPAALIWDPLLPGKALSIFGAACRAGKMVGLHFQMGLLPKVVVGLSKETQQIRRQIDGSDVPAASHSHQ